MLSKIKHWVLHNKIKAVILFVLIALVVDMSVTYLSFSTGPSKDLIRHSFIGTVTENNNNNLSVKDRPGNVKVFIITPETSINKGRDVLKPEDITVGNWVLVNTDEVVDPPKEQPPMNAKRIRIIQPNNSR